MNEHVRWLMKELEKARQARDHTLEKMQHAQAEYDRAVGEVESLERVLKRAKGDAGTPVQTELRGGIPPKPRRRRKPTMSDLVADALVEHGALPLERLLKILAAKGRKTTRNSLNTTLGSKRPERFNRNEEGEWYLTNPEGEPEQ